jgi:uncharacterized membrane protein YgcG
MLRTKPCWRLLGIVLSVCGTLTLAHAVAPEVKDKAHFFKEETIRKLDALARQIARDSGRDFVVETVLTVPIDQKAKVAAMTSEARTKFFSNWCEDRAEATVTHGVYVLICREPAHLALEITKDSQSTFGKEEHDKLLANLLKAFKEKHFDEGILAAAEMVRDRFAVSKKEKGEKEGTKRENNSK